MYFRGEKDNGLLHLIEEPVESRPPLFSNVDDVVTVDGASEYLHCHPQTVRREIARGRLKCIHVGRAVRITRDQLLEYVNSAETNAQ